MPEIDEEELRKNAELRKTLAAIVANPKAREKLLEAHKIVQPDAAIPELDQRAQITEALSGVQKTVSDFIAAQKAEKEAEKAEAEKARVRSRIDTELADLRSQGVTDDGIAGVQKIMESEGILSPKVAWSHFEKLNPPPPITTPSNFSSSWNFMQNAGDTNADIKSLIESRGNNESVIDKMTQDALNEIRGATPQVRR